MFKLKSVMPALNIILKISVCEWNFFVQNERVYM